MSRKREESSETRAIFIGSILAKFAAILGIKLETNVTNSEGRVPASVSLQLLALNLQPVAAQIHLQPSQTFEPETQFAAQGIVIRLAIAVV